MKEEIKMKYVAKFEKVSFNQFKKDFIKTMYNKDMGVFNVECGDEKLTTIYNNIKLPTRATKGSAGFDFVSPITFTLYPNDSILIPTAIKVRIDEGWVLKCYPRSGLGFKFRIQLNNTVAIIDGDYILSDNEGHIFAKITNDSKDDKNVTINAGDAFMQGIFVEYGITYDDECEGIRNGGFGSTSKK